MRHRFLSFALLPLLVAAPLALAAGTDLAPASPRWVDAAFDLAQPNLTHMLLTGELQIHKYTLSGTTQTATQLGRSYANAASVSPSAGEAFLTNAESSMKTDLAASLNFSFPGATITLLTATIDRASLAAPRVDDYTPPIRAVVSATIDRTRADVGIGTLSDAAVEAAFASGARVQTAPLLFADPGYKTTYTIHVPNQPAGLSFDEGSQGTRSADARTLTTTLENLAGPTSKLIPTKLILNDPTAVVPTSEDIRTTIDITMGAPKANATTLPMSVKIAGELRALDLAARFPNVLPSTATLSFLNADALRALYQAGAITDAQLASADDALLAEAKAGLAHSFGPNVTPTGGLTRSDLAAKPSKPYGTQPPVHFVATADAAYALPGDHAKELDLALDIGGTIKFDFALYASKQASTFVLHPPAGVEFTEARGGTLSADHKSATFAVAPDQVAPSAGLSMRKVGVRQFTKENATLGIVIDLQDLRITLGKAIGGDLGSLVVDVTTTGALDVISTDRLPADLQAQVHGPNLDLQYLSGDAVRLALARGLISEAQWSAIGAKLLDDTAAGLAAGMGGPVTVTGGFDNASLAPTASHDTPVLFVAHAHFVKPISGGAPTSDASAIALKTIPQTFALNRVNGFDTTYTVILPRGLDVAGVTPTGATATSGTSADGRSMFVVTPNSDGASATVLIAVTPTFVLVKFWPVVLVAVIVVVLLIGTPVALIVARKNRKKKA